MDYTKAEAYQVFYDDIVNAIDWLTTEYSTISYRDVVIFRVGNSINTFKDKRDNTELKAYLTNIEYVVQCVKLTHIEDTTVKYYSYSKDRLHVPKMSKGKYVFNGTKCKYMPEGYEIYPDSQYYDLVDSQEKIVTGRDTTGKFVCDQIDTAGTSKVLNKYWLPKVEYDYYNTTTNEYEHRVILPNSSTMGQIPESLINSICCISISAESTYRYIDHTEFSGIIVMPVLVLIDQLIGMKELIDG